MRIQLSIDSNVTAKFPGIGVAGVAVSNLNAAAQALGDSSLLMEDARRHLASSGVSLDNLALNPRIASWRDASKASGLKPSEFRSSPEQLSRRLLNGGGISTPLAVVTAYCAISAKHLVPMGGYDVDRLPSPEIRLRMAKPGADKFTPIGGKAASMPITANVVVYAGDAEILCWHFNHRDSENTCLKAETNRAVFFAETVSREHHTLVRDGLNGLCALLLRHGALNGGVEFADDHSPSFTLQLPQ